LLKNSIKQNKIPANFKNFFKQGFFFILGFLYFFILNVLFFFQSKKEKYQKKSAFFVARLPFSRRMFQ